MRSTIGLAVTASLLFACDHAAPASTPAPPPPPTVEASGTYELSSAIDLPPTVLASQSIVDYLALLRLLRNDPAAALVQTLEAAGVPYASDLFALLPGPLKGQLNSGINDYIRGQGTAAGTAIGEIDRILAFSESAFLRFTLDSLLTVPPGAVAGPQAGAHSVQRIRFDSLNGVSVSRSTIARVAVAPEMLDASPSVRVQGALSGGGDAEVVIGDHFFGLAYGEIVYTALDGNGTGDDLRTRLGRAFDCPAMGRSVAGRCMYGLCIGHAKEISDICESGLDQAVKKLHTQLAAMNFQALRFQTGTGQMWDEAADEPRDGWVSRIDRGKWQAAVDIGTGPRDCKATFYGFRLGN